MAGGSATDNGVTEANSTENRTINDVIGNKTDSHQGGSNAANSLYARAKTLNEHVHEPQMVYPTLAAGVTLTTAAGSWALGNFVEIIPANTVTEDFDIHEVLIEELDQSDKTYELHLYYGDTDIEAGRIRFRSSSTGSGVPFGNMQTMIFPANSRVRGKLAIEDGGSKTATVSLRYHEY